MTSDDMLRNILGDDTFNELSAASEHFLKNGHTPLDDVPEELLAELEDIDFEMIIPMTGKAALELVHSLHHFAGTNCADCERFLWKFTGNIVGVLWRTVLAATEGLDFD